MTTNPLNVLFLDDKAQSEAEQFFGLNPGRGETVVPASAERLILHCSTDPDAFLRDFTTSKFLENGYEVLVNGRITQIDALLLDIDFSSLSSSELKYGDPPRTEKQDWGLSILRTVKRMDPDFPVVAFTSLPGQVVSFEAGQIGADDFISKEQFRDAATSGGLLLTAAIDELLIRIERARANCQTRAVYDHEHLVVVEKFAENYDEEERNKIATAAYYRYENHRITTLVSELLKQHRGERRLRILDVGCGTGRIEEELSEHPDRGKLELIALDFSGQMLAVASEKLGRLTDRCVVGLATPAKQRKDGLLDIILLKSPAEKTEFLLTRYPEGFDCIIMAFGVPSYINYSQALPAEPGNKPRGGIPALLRPGGKLLVSVYNEDSALYDRVNCLKYPEDDLPIAAYMDLKRGRLEVGKPGNKRYFKCESFSVRRVKRFLRQTGLKVDESTVETFPTLHLALRNSDSVADKARLDQKDLDLYRILVDRLDQTDLDLSRVLVDRGHYIVAEATRADGG